MYFFVFIEKHSMSAFHSEETEMFSAEALRITLGDEMLMKLLVAEAPDESWCFRMFCWTGWCLSSFL